MNVQGKIESWEKLGQKFPKSGQGTAELVRRVGSTDEKNFVLKRMHHGQSQNAARRARFDQEIRTLQQLNDPHILKIEDFGVDDHEVPYMVTAHCPQGALLPSMLPLGNVIETLYIFLSICEGIAYSHSAGVIHRDIKPANIFLNEKSEAVIGDFGLCFLLNDVDENGRITETLEVATARWFGAPEARDGRLEDVTKAADVYSLGKVLHWMLSNGQVFDRENHRDYRYLLGRDEQDRREYELIHELLDKLIVYDPEQRYTSGEIVRKQVKNLIRVLEARGRPILKNFPHRCDFCGQGVYEFKNGPEDSPQNLSGSESLGLRANHVTPSNSSHFFWMVAICNSCAHVQLFRPDLVPDARKKWTR